MLEIGVVTNEQTVLKMTAGSAPGCSTPLKSLKPSAVSGLGHSGSARKVALREQMRTEAQQRRIEGESENAYFFQPIFAGTL